MVWVPPPTFVAGPWDYGDANDVLTTNQESMRFFQTTRQQEQFVLSAGTTPLSHTFPTITTAVDEQVYLSVILQVDHDAGFSTTSHIYIEDLNGTVISTPGTGSYAYIGNLDSFVVIGGTFYTPPSPDIGIKVYGWVDSGTRDFRLTAYCRVAPIET